PGMVSFPGDPLVATELSVSIKAGGVCNVTRLDFGAHSGTHIDAPVHFIDGAPGIEGVPLGALVGPAVVVDATGLESHITHADLDAIGIPNGTARLLFKTRNSALWELPGFSAEFLGLMPEAASALVEAGVRLVGIDYLSIAPFGDPVPTHRALLGAGVAILEGLDLRSVAPGRYDLICLPVLIPGSDGGPARTLLRRVAG
ncbi:MAG TPA: cyclase family protein, partial [Candidatus Limnocylindrales bacterium]